uniref:Uncharacterized protein n=1 Tax=Octactis speculum TaxID=3111310 RepID=A0A6U3SGV9_9STRA
MHHDSGCKEEVTVSASSPLLDTIIEKNNFPVTCFDMGEMLEFRTRTWFAEANVIPPRDALQSAKFCDIAESKLNRTHRNAIALMLPYSCQDTDITSLLL